MLGSWRPRKDAVELDGEVGHKESLLSGRGHSGTQQLRD